MFLFFWERYKFFVVVAKPNTPGESRIVVIERVNFATVSNLTCYVVSDREEKIGLKWRENKKEHAVTLPVCSFGWLCYCDVFFRYC